MRHARARPPGPAIHTGPRVWGQRVLHSCNKFRPQHAAVRIGNAAICASSTPAAPQQQPSPGQPRAQSLLHLESKLALCSVADLSSLPRTEPRPRNGGPNAPDRPISARIPFPIAPATAEHDRDALNEPFVSLRLRFSAAVAGPRAPIPPQLPRSRNGGHRCRSPSALAALPGHAAAVDPREGHRQDDLSPRRCPPRPLQLQTLYPVASDSTTTKTRRLPTR